MSEPEFVIQRHRFIIGPSEQHNVLDGGQVQAIHFGGAAAHIHNGDETDNAIIRVDDSDDGQTWTPVYFSTTAAANNLALTLVPLSKATILFESARRFVRIRAQDAAGDGLAGGVSVDLTQFPPIGTPQEVSY